MNRKERRAAAKRTGSSFSSSHGSESDRLFSLGVQLHQSGQLDDAIRHYQWAIDQRPDFVGARNNLGAALMARGRFDEAAVQFQRAIALKPDFIELYNNLSRTLFVQGRLNEALGALRRALAIGGNADTKNLFVGCARMLKVLPDLEDFRELMIKALSEPWSRASEVGIIAAALIKQNVTVKSFVDRAKVAWPMRLSADALLDPSDFGKLASHRLLRCLLETTPVCDLELEQLLTNLRTAMLTLASSDQGSAIISEATLSFFGALAQQCFLNEYVFGVTDAESKAVLGLRDALAASIAAADPISELLIVCVAAYYPLHTLPDTNALLGKTWSQPVRALLTQQIQEPQEERQLRNSIPALTPIDDEVSVTVRQHYEENPYPRWVKAEPPIKSLTIDHFLRTWFPSSRYRDLGKGADVDILIAGCGSGQHAVETAQRFAPARVLAVDLSLTSLAYAKRKTHALGLSNLNYGHADLLRLGSIGRTFDTIEAVGSLQAIGMPWQGWRTLLSLLQPRGCMKLGLYSELARQEITRIRLFIAERDYGQTADDIRRCRQEIMSFDDGTPQKNVTAVMDFFSVSECRDLLFHLQEHRHTVPEIADFIAENGLEFLGFELGAATQQQYRTRFPDDPSMTNLGYWHVFETENPRTFVNIYQFWVQKKE
jgi:SAM-dependent methyltransferase